MFNLKFLCRMWGIVARGDGVWYKIKSHATDEQNTTVAERHCYALEGLLLKSLLGLSEFGISGHVVIPKQPQGERGTRRLGDADSRIRTPKRSAAVKIRRTT